MKLVELIETQSTDHFYLWIDLLWENSNKPSLGYLHEWRRRINTLPSKVPNTILGSWSADWHPDEIYGHEYQYYSTTRANLDVAAQELTTIVRELGIPNDVTFTIWCRFDISDTAQELYRRGLFPDRDSTWKKVNPIKAPRKTKGIKVGEFPERIAWLELLAKRFYCCGGDDPRCLFDDDSDLQKFLSKRTAAEKEELQTAYRKIVEKKDNDWILDWNEQPSISSKPKDIKKDTDLKCFAVYLLAILDRLREGGLFQGSEDPGQALIDWNQFQ